MRKKNWLVLEGFIEKGTQEPHLEYELAFEDENSREKFHLKSLRLFSEPIQSQYLDSSGVTFKKVGYEVPLLITNNCKRQVMITKAKLITMQSEREIYTKTTHLKKFMNRLMLPM